MNNLPEKTSDTNKIVINKCYEKLHNSRVIAIYRPLIDIAGSFNNAVYLSQILYWTKNGTRLPENDWYIYKSVDEMFEETGLTLKMQTLCKRSLKEMGLIDIEQQTIIGKGSKSRVRLNPELLRKLCDYYHIDTNVQDITPESWKVGDHPVLRRLISDRIAYYRDLVYCLGNIETSVMLSYLLNRCAVEQKVYKTLTGNDWSRILGISRTVQSHSRLLLKELDIITEKQPLLPLNTRIFTFPQFDTILGKLERLEEYKENPQKLPHLTKLRHHQSKENAVNVENDDKNNNSLENNELSRRCPNLQSEMPKSSVGNDDKNNNSLENNELSRRCPNLHCGDAHANGDAQTCNRECPNLQLSNKEITVRDYSTYTTPLNPPTTISVSFGGGGGVSSHSAISIESKSGCLNIEKPATEQPNKAETATARQHIDFDSLAYPKCFYQETQGNAEQQKALKNELSHIANSIIPFATADEIQEILDEMDRIGVRNMRNYFGKLCKDKARGLFFPTLADKVKYHREESAKNIALQQQTMQLQQAQREQQQLQQQTHDVIQEYADYIEKMVCETKDANELRQKLTDEYNTQAKVIEKQLNTNVLIPVIRICVEKIATILIAYAYNFNDTISNAVELRQKIINQIGEKRLQEYEDLWNTLNIPEMQGKLSEEWNQHLLKKG